LKALFGVGRTESQAPVSVLQLAAAGTIGVVALHLEPDIIPDFLSLSDSDDAIKRFANAFVAGVGVVTAQGAITLPARLVAIFRR